MRMQASRTVAELTRIFKESRSKRQAHERSRPVLEEITTNPAFITEVLRKGLSNPTVLNSKNYPVVSFNVELNPYYHLVANCWIPLPGGETDVSTKAIHHHGTMLLTTATAFGPGYEHWLFSQPKELDPDRELYEMEVTDRKIHARHDLAFVDAFEPHLPLYPSGLTVTFALWSSQDPISWKDQIKRIPILKRHEAVLKRLAASAGLVKQFGLKLVRLFDFYPTEVGFKGMRDRIEFPLGPNEDYLQSLFCVLQQTGNDRLGPLIQQHLDSGEVAFKNPQKIAELLRDLSQGRAIEGQLSLVHLEVPHATFRSQEIERTVTHLKSGKGLLPEPS